MLTIFLTELYMVRLRYENALYTVLCIYKILKRAWLCKSQINENINN